MASIALRTTTPLFSASPLASETTSRAWMAPSAVFFTVAVIWSRAAAVSSRLAACCSVRRDRSSAAVEISPVPAWIARTLAVIETMVCCSLSTAALKSVRSLTSLSGNGASMRCIRSPCDRLSRPWPSAVIATWSWRSSSALRAAWAARSSSLRWRVASASASSRSFSIAASLKRLHRRRHLADLVPAADRRDRDLVVAGRERPHRRRHLAHRTRDLPRQPPGDQHQNGDRHARTAKLQVFGGGDGVVLARGDLLLPAGNPVLHLGDRLAHGGLNSEARFPDARSRALS